jgi:pimeloyl-ACP methyl ester carboxylesterase
MASLPNIVLVHGAWADGSCWSNVIERLQADGYKVAAPQLPETSLADDVAKVRRVLTRQSGPAVLAGHSYRRPGHHLSRHRRTERRRPRLHRGLRARRG